MVNHFKKDYLDSHFQIRILNVFLDVDRLSFESQLNAIDKVVYIRYQQPHDLYYVVHVTFENAITKNLLKNQWAIQIHKNSYYFVPADITNEEYLECLQFRTKLTNFPQGTTAFDLDEIL